MRRIVLYARTPELRRAIELAPALINLPSFVALKDQGRTLAGFVEIEGFGRAFIKRARVETFFHGMFERIGGSRAMRTLRGASALSVDCIPHPRPLAAMEIRGVAGEVRESFVMLEALEQGDTLSRYALGPQEILGRNVTRRSAIFRAVAREVRRMHDTGIFTRDLQETNIFITEREPGVFRVSFLDLEDFRRMRRLSDQHRWTNLVHLDRSVGRFMCRAARLDFLYAYLGGAPARDEARRIVREILSLKSAIASRRNQESARDTARASDAPGIHA